MSKAKPTTSRKEETMLTYNCGPDCLELNESDAFICHKCGIHVEDWSRVKTDEDGDSDRYEYRLKYCPECGAKIIKHTSCEFCRWHLNDGTCLNARAMKHSTSPENSCWYWDERE